jgi:hypothetical protein
MSGKERVALVLDVRKHSEPILRCSATLVHAKLVHRPQDEVAILTIGGARDDVPAIPLQAVCLETLRTVMTDCRTCLSSPSTSLPMAVEAAIGALTGPSPTKRAGKNKVYVISTFDDVPTSDVEALRRLLAGRLTNAGRGPPLHVKFVHFDLVQAASPTARHWIEDLAASHPESIQHSRYHTASQMKTCFPVKELKDVHVIYSGTMKLADAVEVAVKIVPKTKREPFMMLGNAVSNRFEDQTSAFMGDLERSERSERSEHGADLYRPDDIEQLYPVPIPDLVKGYRFGDVIVPMSQPLAELGKLSPERGVWLMGFADRRELSPDLFMGTSKVLFADKTSAPSVAALCSLAAAMEKKRMVAVLRVVLRAGGVSKLMVAHPVARNPAYFILKEAPFMEDIAAINCTPLPDPEPDMVMAAREFVQANVLDDASPDPHRMGNPTLHRAVNFFTERFLGRGDDSFVPPEAELFVECFGEAILDIES